MKTAMDQLFPIRPCDGVKAPREEEEDGESGRRGNKTGPESRASPERRRARRAVWFGGEGPRAGRPVAAKIVR